MANPKVDEPPPRDLTTLHTDAFVAEGRAKIGHGPFAHNAFIDSIPQDEITEELENDQLLQ